MDKGGIKVDTILFQSRREDWTTPQAFFEELDREFAFTLDPAASEENHKCGKFFTKEKDGLSQSWAGERVFCNPPYGREIGAWVAKAQEEAQQPDTLVVMLLPARTDTRWFHKYIYQKAEIRFIKGRLRFGDARNNAPFPSMVVIFH